PRRPNSRIGRQLQIDFADGCEKVRVNWRVPDSVVQLGCGLPDLRQLGRRYVLASNVTVKGRLLRGAAELYRDRPHFLREIGMTNPSDPQIGIQFPVVRLAKSDNVGLIEYGNQGPDNPVKPAAPSGRRQFGRAAVFGG